MFYIFAVQDFHVYQDSCLDFTRWRVALWERRHNCYFLKELNASETNKQPNVSKYAWLALSRSYIHIASYILRTHNSFHQQNFCLIFSVHKHSYSLWNIDTLTEDITLNCIMSSFKKITEKLYNFLHQLMSKVHNKPAWFSLKLVMTYSHVTHTSYPKY